MKALGTATSLADCNGGRAHRPYKTRDLYDSRELGLEPIGANSEVDDERNGELCGVLHLVFHEGHELILLRAWDLEYELVVHLEQHSAAHLTRTESSIDADHRDLDEIRC